MALSDLHDGKGKHPMAVTVTATPLDPIHAMNAFIQAVKKGDVHAAYDAFCMLHEAHKDATEGGEGEDEGDGPPSDKGGY